VFNVEKAVEALRHREEDLEDYFEGIAQYVFQGVGPDPQIWTQLVGTVQMIRKAGIRSLAARLRIRKFFKWLGSVLVREPSSYFFTAGPTHPEWLEETEALVDTMCTHGWRSSKWDKSWWEVLPPRPEPIWFFPVQEVIEVGIQRWREGTGREWMIMMGDFIPPGTHTVKCWTRILAATRVLKDYRIADRLITCFCRWIGRLSKGCSAALWERGVDEENIKEKTMLLELIMLNASDLRQHEEEWRRLVQPEPVADIMMMESEQKDRKAEKLTVSLKGREGTWTELKALIDTGGELSLAGRGCQGMIRKEDCTRLSQPAVIRNVTGERTKLHVVWTATLRLGPPEAPVECKVPFFVCPQYAGELLLGVDAMVGLGVSVAMEVERTTVTFSRPAAKAVIRGGRTYWIQTQGNAELARQ